MILRLTSKELKTKSILRSMEDHQEATPVADQTTEVVAVMLVKVATLELLTVATEARPKSVLRDDN
jgi:hypothetical protein